VCNNEFRVSDAIFNFFSIFNNSRRKQQTQNAGCHKSKTVTFLIFLLVVIGVTSCCLYYKLTIDSLEGKKKMNSTSSSQV
jgi:hypothetical protein